MNWAGYVICDLDGCLSDDRARRHLLPTKTNGVKGYDPYHAACVDDPVNGAALEDVIWMANDMNGKQRSLLVIATGRNEKYRAETVTWLHDALPRGTQFSVLMRPDGNYQPAPELKLVMLNDFFAGLHINPASGWERVIAAFDDREDVLTGYPIASDLKKVVAVGEPPPDEDYVETKDVIPIIEQMLATYKERGALYGKSYMKFADVARGLWPDGVHASSREELVQLGILVQIIGKLVRYTSVSGGHVDSAHDMAVYAAMLESVTRD